MMNLSRSGFQNYTKYAFKLVKQDTDFIDVTLACEDGSKARLKKSFIVPLVRLSKVFSRTALISFNLLHQETDFLDVTLACKDGK